MCIAIQKFLDPAMNQRTAFTTVTICLATLVFLETFTQAQPTSPRPIVSRTGGVPVYSYGEFNVYGVSPTYDPSVVIQAANANPWRSIRPKKSWEIKSNLLGLTPTRSPSSHAPELEIFHPIHLIDDDPTTYGFAGRPVGDPSITKSWIRIDLPRPMVVSSVGMGGKPPANFEIRAFHWDLWQREVGAGANDEQKRWTTVYQRNQNEPQTPSSPDRVGPAPAGPNVYYEPQTEQRPSGQAITVYRFTPVTTREIWLTASDDFELNALEVYDEAGQNVALISRGCGATVSSTQHLFWVDEATHRGLWQMQYDMGIKWLRLSYYLTPLIWTFVEREPGVYTIDPYLDALVTEACENGMEVTLTLGPPDHKLYQGEPDTIEAFCNYTRFMVNHFRGRVQYYEIFNEFYNQDTYGPGKPGPVEEESSRYARLAVPAAKVIRETDPQAKIALCGPCPLVADFILGALKKGMAEYADVLTWHPYSFPSDTNDDYPPEALDRPRHVWASAEIQTYADAVRYLRKEAAKVGFRGELWANETGAYAIHRSRTSNLIAAKYLARSAILHTSLNVPMFWNETTSLLRPAWQPFFANHGTQMKPSHSYYMLRTLGTVLDSARAEKVSFEIDSKNELLQQHAFSLPQGNKLLEVWIAEPSRKKRLDNYPGMKATMTISADQPEKIVGIDLLNGREQDLAFTVEGSQLVVPSLVIKDYPLLFRLEY